MGATWEPPLLGGSLLLVQAMPSPFGAAQRILLTCSLFVVLFPYSFKDK